MLCWWGDVDEKSIDPSSLLSLRIVPSDEARLLNGRQPKSMPGPQPSCSRVIHPRILCPLMCDGLVLAGWALSDLNGYQVFPADPDSLFGHPACTTFTKPLRASK